MTRLNESCRYQYWGIPHTWMNLTSPALVWPSTAGPLGGHCGAAGGPGWETSKLYNSGVGEAAKLWLNSICHHFPSYRKVKQGGSGSGDDQQEALTLLSADKKTRHLSPTWQDMDVLESVSSSLSPLLDFSDYVWVSCLKPVLHTDPTKFVWNKMVWYLLFITSLI